MKNNGVHIGNVRSVRSAEASRIEFLLQRDGTAATRIWVLRTFAIYRGAVRDRRHFAHLAEYRPTFIASCLQFRHWLAANGGYERQGVALPPAAGGGERARS